MFDDLREAIDSLKSVMEPIGKVFNAILNPIETLTAAIDYILLYIPAVCMIIFLFYVVTGSKKVLNALYVTALCFVILKASIIFNIVWLIAVVLAAIVIIRIVGVLS